MVKLGQRDGERERVIIGLAITDQGPFCQVLERWRSNWSVNMAVVVGNNVSLVRDKLDIHLRADLLRLRGSYLLSIDSMNTKY